MGIKTENIKVNLLFGADTSTAIKNVKQLGQMLNQISTKTQIGLDAGPLSEAVSAAQQLQVHLQSALNQKTGKLDLTKLNKSLQSAGTDLAKLGSQLQAVGPQGQQAFNRLAMAVASAEAPMFDLSKRMKDFMDTLGNTVKWSIASGAIHSVQGSLQRAVTHAEKLNKALNDIRIVTGYNTNTMADFANQARRAAQELHSTSVEYAQAALIFYQQGLSGSEVLERANTVVKLAQVTRETTEDVSSQMTAIWNNFADGSKSLEYYADALTKLGAATAASTDEISKGLSQFAAIADTVGLSYEYASAGVATVVDKTRQSAETVGNAFKTVFARIEGLSLGETLEDGVTLNKYSEALAKVGVNILDNNGQLKEMDDILDNLGDRWNLIGQESQVALAQTVGGARQYAQFIALMDNWKDVKKNIELASEAQGELNAQQEIWAESVEGSQQKLANAKDLLSEDLISDDMIIAFNNGLADLIKGIDRVVDAAGGLMPIATMLIMTFSRQLFPILTNGFQRLKNNIDVLTGKAARDVAAMQNQMREEMQKMVGDGSITEAFRKQLELSDQLIAAKQKMALETKNMSIAQKEEYERRMAIVEMMVEETQKSLELQHQLEEEAKAAKAAVTAAGSKTGRSILAESAARSWSAESGNENVSSDVLDRAKTLAMTYRRGRVPTADTVQSKYDKQIADLEASRPAPLGDAILKAAPGQLTAETLKQREQYLKEEEKIEAQIKSINEQRQKEIEALRIAVELTERMSKMNAETAEVTSGEVSLTSGIDNDKLAQQSINKVSKGLSSEGFAITKDKGNKSVNLNASLKNYEKLIKLQIKQGAETKKLTKINKELKKVQDPKELIKLLQKSEQEIVDLLGPSKNLAKNFADLGGPESEKALEKIINKLKQSQRVAEDVDITYEDLAATMADDLKNAIGTEELDAYIQANQKLVQSSPELQAALQRLGVDLDQFGNKSEQAGSKFGKTVQTMVGFVGTISSLTMGIQGLASAFDEGLSPMERFTTILSSMAMLLPILNVLTEKKIKLSGMATAATISEIIAEKAKTTESKAAAVVESFRLILKEKWVGLALVAAATATAFGVSAMFSSAEEEAAALKESAAASREVADANQEQADSNKELIKSFNDLHKQYKETGEISADLKTKAEELGKAYNLEGAALANLTGQYDTYIEKLKQARKKELNKNQRQERSASMDAAASMAEALSEGTGYFEDGGMRFELDTGWGSGDAEILLNLANNSKGKSYAEFLSTNTSYIDEVDMTVKDRTDPYEMQRFIASLKDYRQDIEDEAERLGDDSVLTSAEYESLVTQIKDAEEAFGQLNTAIDNLNAIEAERILLAQEGLDTLTYSSYEGLRNKYSDQISKYLEDQGYTKGSDLYNQYYDSMMEQLFGYSSETQKFETAYNSFNDLRNQKRITGHDDDVDAIERYYKLLNDDDKELFWTLNIDASSTLEDLREQMAEVRKQTVLDTALEHFDIGQSLLSALNSDNKDWDKIKEQFEELGISTWHAFAEMSQQEQIELINETNLKNAQTVLSSFQSDINRIQSKTYTHGKVRESETTRLADLETALGNSNTRLEKATEIDKLLGMSVTTGDYQQHAQMANYLDKVAKAIGSDSIENPDAFTYVSAMLKDLHKLNTDLYYSGPNDDLMDIPNETWEKYIEQFGGAGSQVDKAYQQWKEHVAIKQNHGSRTTIGKSVEMSAAEAQGWKEAIAAGALKGKRSAEDSDWILDLEGAQKEQAAAQEAVTLQSKVLENIPTEIQFNQQKADSIAKIRTQYADALDKMRQYAEQQGINTEQYDAAVLALETFNGEVANQIYLTRISAVAMLEYSEGVSGLIENGNEWLEVLENSNASLAEQTRILPALKESMTKLLNIEGSDFDALWGGGFFGQASNINLMRAAITGNEQALLDLQLATALQLNKGQQSVLLSGLQSHSLAVGTQYRVGDKNTTDAEKALYNRLQNALTMGVSEEALKALGYEIEANGTQLIGYSIAAKGYTQDNIDALEELSKQAIESITPYKEINDQLSAYNRELEKAESLQDRLYGDSQIKALNSEREILEATNKALAEKVEWAKAYQKEYADELEAKGFGIKFENGYITNYTEIAAGLKNSGRYEDLEELNELVGKYDEHLQTELDVKQEIQENEYRMLDIAKERLDIELETNQAIIERSQDLIDLQKTLMEDEFYQMAELLTLMTDRSEGKTSQFNNIMSNLETIDEYYKDIQEMSDRYGSNMANYAEGLETTREGLTNNIEALQDLKIEMKDYYSNVLSAAAEKINQYTGLIDNNTAVLDHYVNVMDLVGKSTDYKKLGVILQGQAETAKAQLDISKTNYELFAQEAANAKAQYEAAMGTDQEQWWETQWMAAEQAAQEAQSQMIEDTEAWIETEKSIIENGFKEIGQTLENALTGGTSFDSLTTAMDRAVNIQEEYLTTTNKIYETNKLMNTAQKEIDKTSNTVAKKKLAQFVNETKQLQGQTKLSQYELQIQQAKYDLLLAEIALEESQNAKSTVRLQRDASGRFGYVYTADQNAVDAAMQNVADKENDLYNIGLQGANDYANKYLTTMSEMYNSLDELNQQRLAGAFETDAEYYQEREKLVQYYQEKLTQYSELYGTSLTTDARVVADAWSTTFMKTSVPMSEMNAAVQDYLKETDRLFDNWTAIGKAATEVFGSSMDDTKVKVNNVVSAVGDLADKLGGDNGVIDKVGQLLDKFSGEEGLLTQMSELSSSIDESITKYAGQLKNVNDELDKLAKYNGKIPGMPTANNVAGMSGDQLKNVIAAALKEVGFKPADSSYDKTITDWNILGPYYEVLEAMKRSGYATSDDDLGKLHKSMGTNLKAQQSDLDKINISDFSRWILGTIGGIAPPDVYFEVMQLLGEGKYIQAVKAAGFTGFSSGGYTGEWGPEGKLAMLHEKEIVLNANDTANLLAALGLLDNIIATLDRYSISAQLGGILSSPMFSMSNQDLLEQNVHIEASFPNVQDRNEIEEALNNLVNKASQYANRK